jgi:uncharacterized cupredoxin-like copper-binding protein
MRPVSLILILSLSACAAHRAAVPASGPIADGGTVTVKLSNFSYDPETLRLRAGVPVRLRLVNESDGGHDFKAPGFFAASTFPAGTAPPPGGAVDVAAGSTVELALLPRLPGTYKVTCTHFLHSAFGMTGTVEIVAAP